MPCLFRCMPDRIAMWSLRFLRNAGVCLGTFLVFASAANAQHHARVEASRIAVVASAEKTNIWISDFPKSSSVVVFDQDDNLISIVSTNEFGAAFISLPKRITTTIHAKTVNGEISVSNKAVVGAVSQNIVSATATPTEAGRA